MIPSAIHVRNYRSFPGPQTVELRPLTLFYGQNSAGKSALVRLLPLLADSMGSEGGPLNLDSPAARGSSYGDVRWKGPTEEGSPDLALELEWRGDPRLSSAYFSFERVRAWERLLIKRFEFKGDEQQLLLKGDFRFREEEQVALALTYALTLSGASSEVPVQFRGLVPEIPPGHAEPVWSVVRDRLLGLQRAVLWLGSRSLAERTFLRPTAPRWNMKPDGSDIGALLATQPEVLDEVSRWCRQHLSRSVEITELPPSSIGVTLRNVREVALAVDLLDAGEGVSKVLPVLAALSLVRLRAPGAPRILAVEEPESNLHPVLQAALSKHIAAVVSGHPDPPCVVLETHSQHILLGVQLQVAKGELQPDQVQVYWVYQEENGRSVAEPVQLDEDGRLKGNWPPDVYTEIHDMAGELLLARQERRRS